MYNRIGLPTPRGSGTSGYIEYHKAVIKNIKSRNQFLSELKESRNKLPNCIVTPSEELISHNNKRNVYVKLEDLKQNLISKKYSEPEINSILSDEEKYLLNKIKKGEQISNINYNNAYDKLHNKEITNNSLKQKLKLNNDYKIGDAFDFEKIEQNKLEKEYLNMLELNKELESEVKKKQKKEKKHKKSKKIKKEKRKYNFSDNSSLSN